MPETVEPYRIPLSAFRLTFIEWADEADAEAAALRSTNPMAAARKGGMAQAFRDAAAHLASAVRQDAAGSSVKVQWGRQAIDHDDQTVYQWNFGRGETVPHPSEFDEPPPLNRADPVPLRWVRRTVTTTAWEPADPKQEARYD